MYCLKDTGLKFVINERSGKKCLLPVGSQMSYNAIGHVCGSCIVAGSGSGGGVGRGGGREREGNIRQSCLDY